MIEGNRVYIVYRIVFDDSWSETRSVRAVFSEDGFSSFKKDAIKFMSAKVNETKPLELAKIDEEIKLMESRQKEIAKKEQELLGYEGDCKRMIEHLKDVPESVISEKFSGEGISYWMAKAKEWKKERKKLIKEMEHNRWQIDSKKKRYEQVSVAAKTEEELFDDFLNEYSLAWDYMGIINKGDVNDIINWECT